MPSRGTPLRVPRIWAVFGGSLEPHLAKFYLILYKPPMQKIVIEGGHPLKGEVKISGSKNSALPILFATLLAEDPCLLKNIPRLRDIETTIQLLKSLGSEIEKGKSTTAPIRIQFKHLKSTDAPYELVKTMRASVLVMGPLLGRFHEAHVSLPGGCAIGARPIHLHLKAFEQMGAKIDLKGGYVHMTCKKLHGARIVFDTVTVTGTENVMMAATQAKGETLIENAAREPEILDLANFLKKMGAHIEGAGTETIRIQGDQPLHGCTHPVIPDRIEAGTFMMAGAFPGSDLRIRNIDPLMLESLIARLRECGTLIKIENNDIHVTGPKQLIATDITTAPYPGFATDFQAQFMALMTQAQGTSVIRETIFENRFMHAQELLRMGAHIKIEGNTAVVKGGFPLSGAPVMASDLRASAALILAGLCSEGLTEVHRIYHLDRGYDRMEHKFRKLGARMKRKQVRY